MAHEIKIPAVGESITSASIGEWHKKDGEPVREGEQILTIETDKISTELMAEHDGVLHIDVAEGEEVEIGAVVGRIEEGGAGGSSASAEQPAGELVSGEAPDSGADSPKLTEAAERLASESSLDTSALSGTGKGGTITKKDVEAALEERSGGAASEPAPSRGLSVVDSAPEAGVTAPKTAEGEGRTSRKKLSPLRRKIATQLVSVQQQAALLTTFNECDMSAVMSLRKEIQESFVAKHGLKLGFMSFFIKAVVDALKAVPMLNARIDGDELVQNHFFDIGVAVGTEKGLIVPVIRDADQKSFADIERDIIDYATKAREGRIQLSDITGGVFTVSNGGVYGSLLSTPIINPPQSGILGMHTIQQRPIAVDGQVVIRPMMYLALSYDHRIVDGKEAVTFLVRIKECIESPSRLLIGA